MDFHQTTLDVATTPPHPVWSPLDRTAGDLEGQVYRAVRDRILQGQLLAGQRLPSTRVLANALGVARSTVVLAYDRLKAEGYLEAASGSASRVAPVAKLPSPGPDRAEPTTPWPSAEPPAQKLFEPGIPDLTGFPHATWARCLGARARSLRIHDLGYGDAGGIRELQEAIIAHVADRRGVVARPEQVLVLPSTRAAIGLLASIRLQPAASDASIAWMEEPGYPATRALLQAAGARIVPVPCDSAGIDVSKASGAPARLIYVTPSHQYPTGATMSLQRRLALLEVAETSGALVIEDDYDSEFQYASRPIAALQGIDRNNVVAYLGTFSKVLAPGVRVAYAIVPPWLLEDAHVGLQLRGAVVPIHVQAALADFIREGRLRAYIRKMNAAYAARMAMSMAALSHHCGQVLHLGGGTGGLQLAAWFKDQRVDDRATAHHLSQHGYAMQPMSRFHLGPPRAGLVFGISRVTADTVEEVVAKLGRLLPA